MVVGVNLSGDFPNPGEVVEYVQDLPREIEQESGVPDSRSHLFRPISVPLRNKPRGAGSLVFSCDTGEAVNPPRPNRTYYTCKVHLVPLLFVLQAPLPDVN